MSQCGMLSYLKVFGRIRIIYKLRYICDIA